MALNRRVTWKAYETFCFRYYISIRDTVNRFGSFLHGASSEVNSSANKYRTTNHVSGECY